MRDWSVYVSKLASVLIEMIDLSPTGLVAKEVYPYAHSVVGMDISSGVVELCNKRFKEELGADEKETYAIAANILTDKDILPGKLFDVVFVSTALLPSYK